MTYKELWDVLDREVMRSDRESEYGSWIRQGLRSICQDVTWSCTAFEDVVKILAGRSSVSMPSDFKELQRARSPITVAGIPCIVSQKAQLTRLGAVGVSATPAYVFLTTDGNNTILNTMGLVSADTEYSVQYFRVLPDLVAANDENYLTRTYPEMVKAKIKAVAFEALNDTVAGEFEALYAAKRRAASADDAYRRVAGRVNRMGGG